MVVYQDPPTLLFKGVKFQPQKRSGFWCPKGFQISESWEITEDSGTYMGVSENVCTPKSSNLIGISIINHPNFEGNTPILGKHPHLLSNIFQNPPFDRGDRSKIRPGWSHDILWRQNLRVSNFDARFLPMVHASTKKCAIYFPSKTMKHQVSSIFSHVQLGCQPKLSLQLAMPKFYWNKTWVNSNAIPWTI